MPWKVHNVGLVNVHTGHSWDREVDGVALVGAQNTLS
jgi:hypothetical protein